MALKHSFYTIIIIKAFYNVYNELGHGFLESVYENALLIALRNEGLSVQKQKSIPVKYHDIVVGEFKADLIVENKVILELKAVRNIDNSHIAQLLNYLKATDMEVGLLFNFGKKPEFKRLTFSNNQ